MTGAVGFLYILSYAPMSHAEPWGRVTPRMSVEKILLGDNVVGNAFIAGDALFKTQLPLPVVPFAIATNLGLATAGEFDSSPRA